MGFQKEELARTIIKVFDLPMTWQEYDEMAHAELNKLFPNCQLMPGAERLIKHLKSQNIPIAVATSSAAQSIAVKTTHHKKLFELFDHIVMGSTDPDVKQGKPMPDIFLVAASRFKEDTPNPENVNTRSCENFINLVLEFIFQCLVFEDSPNGVKAAIAAGMQVVMVPDPEATADMKEGATQVLKSLLDFKPEDFGLPKFIESS